jgi:hypothetical protein
VVGARVESRKKVDPENKSAEYLFVQVDQLECTGEYFKLETALNTGMLNGRIYGHFGIGSE